MSTVIAASGAGAPLVQTAALGIRFLLELLGLVALAAWGYQAAEAAPARWALAIGVPLAAATIWGVFRIPDDPKPAPVAVPGPVRLLIEAAFFGAATAALADAGQPGLAAAFGGAVLVDYALLPRRLGLLARWRRGAR